MPSWKMRRETARRATATRRVPPCPRYRGACREGDDVFNAMKLDRDRLHNRPPYICSVRGSTLQMRSTHGDHLTDSLLSRSAGAIYGDGRGHVKRIRLCDAAIIVALATISVVSGTMNPLVAAAPSGVSSRSPRHRPPQIVEILGGRPRFAISTSTRLGTLSSIVRRASGPPSSVRTQPGAISTIARRVSVWRTAKLRMNWFSAALLPR